MGQNILVKYAYLLHTGGSALKRALVWGCTLALILALAAPGLAAGPQSQPPIAFTVLFQSETLPAGAAELVSAAGGTVTYAVPEIGVLQAQGDPGFLHRMAAQPGVHRVSPSIPVSLTQMELLALPEAGGAPAGPGDLYDLYQWDIQRVTRDGGSWALEAGTHEVVVGIIDTGLDAGHPDLAANVMPGGRNFVPAGGYLGTEPYETGDPADTTDRHGHGTHVAGNIAANGRVIGVGPQLGIRSYRVFGTSAAFTEWIWAAIIAAADDGVDVINMSLGGYDILGQVFYVDPATGRRTPLGNDAAYHTATTRVIQYAISRGVTVVAAAGNDGINATRKPEATALINQLFQDAGLPLHAVGATFRSPGGHPGVITVSATGPDDSLATYSTYGPGYITLAAPGGDFQRYPDPGWFLDMNLSTWSADSLLLPASYVFSAGTSMATPKVAAAAALVKAQHPDYSPAHVTARLLQTAADLGRRGTDPYFGHGLVDVYAALGGG